MPEFQAHWLEHHSQFGPRVKSIRRYVQYHVLQDDPIREAMAQAGVSKVEPFDGVAMAWFDDLQSLREDLSGHSVVQEAWKMKSTSSIHSRTTACVTEEHVMVEPVGKGPYVLLECLKRRPISIASAFPNCGSTTHISATRPRDGTADGIHPEPHLAWAKGAVPGLGDGEEPFDGVVTAYFDSMAKFKALVMSPLASQESFEDEKKFIDHPSPWTCSRGVTSLRI